jgi:hypothetical protein
MSVTFDEVIRPNYDSKAIKVLKILFHGKSVNLYERDCILGETEGSYKLVCNTEYGKALGLDVSLESFIAECKKISDEEITLKLGEITMKNIKL